MLDQRSRWWLNVMLRLKAGQSAEAAEALLRAAQPQIREAAMPPDGPPQARLEFLKAPFTVVSAANGVSVSGLRRQYQRPLLVVLAIVGLVLAIGCVNLANLLLARASARQQEMSVRRALGAGRARLTRQLLIESFTLAAIGGLAGLLAAAWGSGALVAQLSDSVSRVSLDLSLDWRTLLFTALTTVATVVLFGLAPAFRASAARPIDALRSARADAGERRGRLSGSLVVAQVALSLVLVVGAILLVRTFVTLQGRAAGFDRKSVLIVNVNASRVHPNAAGRLAFLQQLVDAAAVLPGVEAAGGSAIPPILGSALSIVVDAPRGDLAEAERRTLINAVTPRWFGAYGTPVLAGRDVGPADTAESLAVAVVNEAFRRRFLLDANALGETVSFALGGTEQRSTARRIVGVVGDAPYRSLRDEIRPTVYVPLAQWTSPFPLSGISIGVRATNPGPAPLRRPLTAALTAINPNLAFNFRLFDEQVNASVAQERLLAILSGAFGALALLLAALGMYGVTAYSVGRRRYEIGLRLALGAEPRGVVRLVLGRLFLLVGAGVAIGALASRWAIQLVAPILSGFEPGDAASFAGGVVILLVVAGIAGWIPAWRAARIDPAETLRSS